MLTSCILIVASSVFAACDHACTQQKKTCCLEAINRMTSPCFFLAKSALTSDPPQMWQSAVAGAHQGVVSHRGGNPCQQEGVYQRSLNHCKYPYFGGSNFMQMWVVILRDLLTLEDCIWNSRIMLVTPSSKLSHDNGKAIYLKIRISHLNFGDFPASHVGLLVQRVGREKRTSWTIPLDLSAIPQSMTEPIQLHQTPIDTFVASFGGCPITMTTGGITGCCSTLLNNPIDAPQLKQKIHRKWRCPGLRVEPHKECTPQKKHIVFLAICCKLTTTLPEWVISTI